MANTYTTNYNLTKPEVGGDTNQWGGHLNDNMDGIDTQMKANATASAAAQSTANAALPKAGGTMTGPIVLSGAPTLALHAATKAYADTFLPLAGGTLTGNLTLNASPTSLSPDLQAATKKYVDDSYSNALIASGAGLPTTGGTMTGYLILNADPIVALGASTKQYVDTAVAGSTAIANAALPKVGGTMTGPIVLSGNPTAALQAAPKQYVDTFVPLSGNATMTGPLILSGDPTNANGAATKSYVDTNFVSKSGNVTLTGTLTLNGNAVSALQAVPYQQLQSYAVPLTGGASITGSLTLPTLTVTSTISGTSLAITCNTLTATGSITSNGDITAFSDERIKEDIRTIEYATDIVNQLRGVSYIRKDTGKLGIGVVAQEVEKILPQLVATDENGMKSVAYANLVGVLIEAIKELNARVEELEAY